MVKRQAISPEMESSIRNFAYLILPFGLLIALCVSGGAHLQYYAFSSLEGVPDLSHGDLPPIPIQLPALSDWIALVFGWPLFAGIAVAAFSFRDLTARGIFFRTAFAFAIVVTSVDAVIQLANRDHNLSELGKSAFSNVLACIVIAWLVLCVTYIAEFITKTLKGSKTKIAASITIISLGLCANITLYYLLFFFVQRIPVDFTAATDQNYSGLFIAKGEETIGGFGKLSSDLQFTPRENHAFRTYISSPSGKPQIRVVGSKGSTYGVAVRPLVDCWGRDVADKIKTNNSSVISSANNIDITLDEGAAYIQSGSMDGTYSFISPYPTFFWNSVNKAQAEAKQFVSLDESIIWKTSGDADFYVWFPGGRVKDKEFVPTPRNVKVTLDGKTRLLRFSATPPRLTGKKLECREFSGDPKLDAGTLSGVHVRLRSVSPSRPAGFDGTVSLRRLNGWTSASYEPPSESRELGKTTFLGMQSGVRTLVVRGNSVPVTPTSDLIAVGSLSLSADSDNRAQMRGLAWRLWLDGRILNESRWGTLLVEWQIAIISWFGAILLAFSRVSKPVIVRLSKNRKFVLAT